MTRLTIATTGDPLTFRPVTSSIVRKSKDGDVNVIILLFGTDYNISMAGIIQQDSKGDIDDNTKSISVNNNSEIELAAELETAGTITAKLIGSFSSFTYFYPGMRIRGHLKLPITSHGVPVPVLEAHYHLTDLLSKDALFFILSLKENNLELDVLETVDDVDTVIYNEVLDSGIDEYFFEFDFLINGMSKFYSFANYGTATQIKTRKWIGNLKAKLGECNVAIHNHNSEEVLRIIKSDFIFIDYPKIFIKFDRTTDERFIGKVRMYDDLNNPVEANWKEIRSRDYKFEGNRVIENGMIRLIVKTVNPNIEVWGWNYNDAVPSWEKCMTIEVESDSAVKSLKIQNIIFEYFTKMQIKFDINFGTSIYSIIMSRGDPYISVLNKAKLKFKFKSAFNRLAGDFKNQSNGYTLKNTDESGSPLTKKATGTATCVSVVATDTITINGLVYTAVTGVKANNTEFSVDTSGTACATDLADSIKNDTRQGMVEVEIDTDGNSVTNVVTITAKAGGTSGNNITMSQTGGTITLSGATLTGGAATGGTGIETLSVFTLNDNWYSVYNNTDSNAAVGWLSSMIKPDTIKIEDISSELVYTFTYPKAGNVFGIGILPTFPNNLVGGVPFPFIVGTQDEYVKWRANEAVLSFRELETIKRR